jgi:hypothetical protein
MLIKKILGNQWGQTRLICSMTLKGLALINLFFRLISVLALKNKGGQYPLKIVIKYLKKIKKDTDPLFYGL